MSKYDGIKNVQAVVEKTQAVTVKTDKKGGSGGLVFRFVGAVMVLVVGAIVSICDSVAGSNLAENCSLMLEYSVIEKNEEQYLFDVLIEKIMESVGKN